MKLQFGNLNIRTAARLVIVALTLVVLVAIYCATANFQSLEMSARFSLHARPPSSDLRPLTSGENP